MNEYISKNAVRQMLGNRYGGFLLELDAIPTADVAPVVHGRWIDGKCSNCGVNIPTDDLYDVIFGDECHYCYYCGAKMDGGVDDAAD